LFIVSVEQHNLDPVCQVHCRQSFCCTNNILFHCICVHEWNGKKEIDNGMSSFRKQGKCVC